MADGKYIFTSNIIFVHLCNAPIIIIMQCGTAVAHKFGAPTNQWRLMAFVSRAVF